jgi:pyruvate dehydrogenase E2 component (dihydrolipoamide acetyltransferase)
MTNLKMVAVPDIGNFKDVSVIEVMVKVGDTINAEDNLITLETDKAAMDVPAPFSGIVREIKVKNGDKVSKGSVILMMESTDSAKKTQTVEIPSAPAAAPLEQVNDPVAVPPVAKGNEILAHASPAVRHLAHELGVDLSQVAGSGEKGRVTKEDVQNFVKSALTRNATGGMPQMPVVDFAQFGPVVSKPLSRIQKISGANLHRNWVSIPHVTQFDTADITEMEDFRKQLGKEYSDSKITLLAFLLKAVVAALQKYPDFNASLNNDSLVLKKYFHIGVAVDTPEGLMVPVLRDIANKGLLQLASELGEISAKARDKKLSASEMQGGCFTISSLGGIGGTAFTPIINAPEVAILGVSRACMQPVWQNDKFVPRLMLPLSLSYDHRVIDGAQAARFTTYLALILSDIRRLAL